MDDADFLEGRDTVTVYRLNEPDDFDPGPFVQNLGVVFGVEDTRLGNINDAAVDDGPAVVRLGPVSGDESTVSWGQQTGSWGYTAAKLNGDSICSLCEPATISNADALARAQELFAAAGAPVADLDWEVGRANYLAGSRRVDSVRVEGYRQINGNRYGSPFDMYFFDGDQVLKVLGYTWEPIPRGEVGLLSPDEALRLRGVLSASDPAVSDDTAELIYDVEYRRETARAFLVPVYRYDLNEELGLTTTALAIRPTDLPTE